jgi:hypothetical protein
LQQLQQASVLSEGLYMCSASEGTRLLLLLLLLLQVFCAAAAREAVLQAQQGQLHGEHKAAQATAAAYGKLSQPELTAAYSCARSRLDSTTV